MREPIAKQILLVNTLGNVYIKVWRICILMLECKGLKRQNISTINFPPQTHAETGNGTAGSLVTKIELRNDIY